ncbi:Sorting nexin-13 like [Actinidia chinensis var. chinensis]|uniref:Sorting nexin-13 like n=1 Tax=Actinidia chinensis var. chinensis TaxID=1590841 RepID=A0A2R6QFR8_ACTCC|nr:Sorting nexin-13 like [Actinidia chinensis var. chinensis]
MDRGIDSSCIYVCLMCYCGVKIDPRSRMSTEKKAVLVRDLAEEAKKRIVFLVICVVGLSYLMSLTSSSVWVNVPAAAFLIVILRYFSLDFEMRRKAAVYNSKPASANIYSQKKPLEGPKPVFEKPDWRRKVNSPVVEDAIDHFTRHIVSEWVTDLWYSRITPDRQGPEELVHIINGVLAEISSRMRNVNLIDLLTRDIINLFCTHLELFRASQEKIEIEQPGSLTFERRDMELKFVMAAENKLHPALFSAEAEHKVLQHLMDGLISFTFKPEDLQCSLFHFIVRELLACAVMRPVLNLASPRFINERIESLVIERTSFLSGDGQDILNFSKGHVKSEDSSDDSEAEMLGRIYSGTTASSSASSTTIPGSHRLVVNAQKNSLVADSFLTLRCEVLGANIAKSGSETLAVYSISVTDINNNSWSIKRRFRHFEELHRRLKEYTEYSLHLPPKHFLSTGLDVPVIQERCKLLDQYLKKLLQIPTISGSIEVWDFLSVDSQTYVFLNSISIIETLSAGTPNERSKKEVQTGLRPADPLAYRREQRNAESTESVLPMKHNSVADASKLNPKGAVHSPHIKPSKEFGKPFEDSGGFNNEEQSNLSLTRKSRKGSEADDLQASSQSLVDAATDPTIPTEWVPPNVSVPILDLVDVIFQLHDGGWIRRKAFWVAKQVLQLGMGDAFDDWLIEKIQVLRRGTVVASGIRKIEQILWPDGIFLTKHPKRQRPKPSGSTPQNSPKGQPATPISSPKKEDIRQWDEQQQKEAERRAKFVHELMIDKAPAALVGLVGRKEYEHCAKDLYFFLQSSVGLKHFAFDLLELLLLSAFPEMDYVFRQLHEEKQKFGEFTPN